MMLGGDRSDDFWVRTLLAVPDRQEPEVAGGLGDSRRTSFTRNGWLDYLWNYRVGEQPIGRCEPERLDLTRTFIRLSKNQYSGLIVQSLLDRVQPAGVRRAGTRASEDTDRDFQSFLNLNSTAFMDAENYALTFGEGHILISRTNDGEVIAAPKDPRNFIVVPDPLNPRRAMVALEFFSEQLSGDSVFRLFRSFPDGTASVKTWLAPPPEAAFLPNYFGVFDQATLVDEFTKQLVPGVGLPIVSLRNQGGVGEFAPHLNLVDRISNGIMDRLNAAKLQIFLQRAVTGLPKYDADGKEIDYDNVLSASPGSIWTLPANVEFWESKQLAIAELLAPPRDDVRELATVSQTPFPLIASDSANQSAEGAAIYAKGIGFKAEDRQRRWGVDLCRFAYLAAAYAKGSKPDFPFSDLAPVWAPTDRETWVDKAQAAATARQAGAPALGIWSDILRLTPAELREWTEYKEEETLMELGSAAKVGGEVV